MENYQANEARLSKLSEVFKILKSLGLKPTMDTIPVAGVVDISASAFGIDPLTNGTIEIDITVPGVFEKIPA